MKTRYKVKCNKYPKSVINNIWDAEDTNGLKRALYEMKMIYGNMDFWRSIPTIDQIEIINKYFDGLNIDIKELRGKPYKRYWEHYKF